MQFSSQREQYEQSEQFEQREQREQFEQSEQFEQFEQYEQYEQSEQSEQSSSVASASRAFSSLPHRSTDARLPLPSVTQVRLFIFGSFCFEFLRPCQTSKGGG